MTDAAFDPQAWQDCRIWKLEIVAGDPDEGDGTGDLVLGVDLIVDSLCGFERAARFKLAPATLTFHSVRDLKIGIDWGDSGGQLLVHPVAIAEIVREPFAPSSARPGAPPYHLWRILLSWPKGGELAFVASGFTQTPLAEPIVSDKDYLSLSQRRRMLGES
jgi:hypothetical protein